MDWKKPSGDHPVWCTAVPNKVGVPTAESVSCTTQDPARAGPELAALEWPASTLAGQAGSSASDPLPSAPPVYQEFTSQDALGHFLLVHYKIKPPRLITSCDTCHR